MFSTSLFLLSAISTLAQASTLTIKTSVGTVTGFINATVPHVRQFQGIPFASPPIGSLRWAPPTTSGLDCTTTIDATYQRATCSQTTATSKSLYSENVPQYYSTAPFGEDCLYLNIYTPVDSNCTKDELLPVFVWIHGGGMNVGGIQTQYQLPMKWVERTRDHIVVQINYRLNIFGFPNSAGLDPSGLNLGIMDQRLALEWVRTNIASFGGDPSKIALWGQSAGAASVDIHKYAYRSDPIASSLIADSGVATLQSGSDFTRSNFSFVASHFGCTDTDAKRQLECMRFVSAQDIEDFLFNRTVAGTKPSVSFGPIADGKIIFSPAEYTAMATAGNYSKVPMIIGSNTNEGASFVTYNATNPNLTAFDISTATTFTCPAAKLANLQAAASVAPVFRYQYAGNFSNISPLWWMGAYHSSELPLLFGTHGDFRGASTPFESQLSATMQNLWVAFAREGASGLTAMGWPKYGNGAILQFGKDGVLMQNVSKSVVDAACL
ncbi:carboxylesterase-like protein [Tricladium varicosporioides]|nr:carboxylesterase-like protein [Hymenoscyphus varicosporioides]